MTNYGGRYAPSLNYNCNKTQLKYFNGHLAGSHYANGIAIVMHLDRDR